MEIGADISGWQMPNPNLSGLDFCMIKSTDGTSGTNQYFQEQHDEVLKLGLVEGSYHYPEGIASPIDEANWYLEFTKRIDGQGQAFDFEGVFLKNQSDPVGYAETFLNEVENATNNKPGIYISFSLLQTYDFTRIVNNDNWLWLAEWNGQNQPTITQFPIWAMWQYADTSLSGGDADYFNGDLATLKKYFSNKTPSVQFIEPVDLQIPAP